MKVLIISEFIAPVRAVASIRWTKLGKYLHQAYGIEIEILTNKKRYCDEIRPAYYQYDPSALRDLQAFRVHEIPETIIVRIINAIFYGVSKVIISQKREPKTTPVLSNQQNEVSFFQKIYRAVYARLFTAKGLSLVARAMRMEIDWSQYDVIVSSFEPRWVHEVAGGIKKRFPDLIWIADYRDSAIYAGGVLANEANTFAAKYTSSADMITAVSQGTIEALNVPDDQNRVVVTNGYDPEELTSRERMPFQKFVLAYTGTLYNQGEAISDLKPLLRALSELIDEGRVCADHIELSYAGVSEEEFVKQVSAFPRVPWKSYGLLSRDEALKLQNRASLLLLCTWNTKRVSGIITGKVYEYFSSKVPIVCLCAGEVPYSASREMIEKSNTGFCYEEACDVVDYKNLVSFLYNKYTEWKTGGMTTCGSNWDYINSFGYDHLAEKVYELINDLKNKEDVPS